jgi:hypothetical protein
MAESASIVDVAFAGCELGVKDVEIFRLRHHRGPQPVYMAPAAAIELLLTL